MPNIPLGEDINLIAGSLRLSRGITLAGSKVTGAGPATQAGDLQTYEQAASDKADTDEKINNTNAAVTVIKGDVEQVTQTVIYDVDDTAYLDRKVSELQLQVQELVRQALGFRAAIAGDMVLASRKADPIELSAAVLNTCPAGYARVDFLLELQNANGDRLRGIDFTPDIGVVPTYADGDIGAPTLDPVAPTFVDGRCRFTLVVDTDAGATKTHAALDTVVVTVKTAADSKLLGHAVADLVLNVNTVA